MLKKPCELYLFAYAAVSRIKGEVTDNPTPELSTWLMRITILTLPKSSFGVLILFGCYVCETSCLRDFNCTTE